MKLMGDSLIEAVQDMLSELKIKRFQIGEWTDSSDEVIVMLPNSAFRRLEVDEEECVMLADGETAGWQYGVRAEIDQGSYDPNGADAFALRFWQE